MMLALNLNMNSALVRSSAPSGAPTAARFVAPSALAVSIAEASLAFGDTATASVSVSGYPTPDLAYQWTLDAVDVDGQTNATFEGVPAGALRVRVTATNDEGSAGPTTSAPVTVAALAPDAFSAGQWTLDANGVSGQLAVTLLGLPPSNGAAISSVERQVDGGAWVALAGVALGAAYTITGLTDDTLHSVKLRAVNSIGASPASDAKTAAPFAPAAPETVGDNGWTFQPVASSTDLEVFIAQTPDWAGFSLNVDAGGAQTATYTALEAGPVNLAVPTISGTPALGATMTASTGRWVSLTGVTSYAYVWKRNGTPISGASASTYNLVSADASTDLSVVVTPTDAQGTPAAGGVESLATAIGAFAPATPDLFAVAVGALKNANAFDMGDAAWTNDGSTTIAALTADGPYLGPQTITVSVAQNFRGRKTSLGTLTNATLYRCAAMVKAGTGNRCQIMIESGANSATVYTADVSGAVALTVTHSASRPGTITNEVIEDVGGGYRRIRFDYTPNASAAHTIKINPFAGVVGASIDAYGVGVADQA